MASLSRFLKLRARSRYWKRRALKAERELSATREQFDAEMWRNREREDTMVSASVLGQRQMYGVPPRTGPAIPLRPNVSRVPVEQPSYQNPTGLGGIDLMEWQTQWAPHAQAAGVDLRIALKEFQDVLASRRSPLNDDQNLY